MFTLPVSVFALQSFVFVLLLSLLHVTTARKKVIARIRFVWVGHSGMVHDAYPEYLRP